LFGAAVLRLLELVLSQRRSKRVSEESWDYIRDTWAQQRDVLVDERGWEIYINDSDIARQGTGDTDQNIIALNFRSEAFGAQWRHNMLSTRQIKRQVPTEITALDK